MMHQQHFHILNNVEKKNSIFHFYLKSQYLNNSFNQIHNKFPNLNAIKNLKLMILFISFYCFNFQVLIIYYTFKKVLKCIKKKNLKYNIA